MIKRKKIIATLLATAMIVPTIGGVANAASVSNSTIAGADRYKTAVEISKQGWSSSTNAVLINGDKGLVDALTATPYASLKNAPILVTGKDTLNSDALKRLRDMGTKHVDIVGGPAVVSENIVNQLKSNGMTVNRISGTDRYATAVAVAEAINKISRVSKVAVVNGATGLPDAVSIAAPAADNNIPILLSDPKNGMSEANKFISGKSIYKSYVVGSTGVVSDSIKNSLPGTKIRLGGVDRHATNVEVIDEFYPQTNLDNIYVAKSGYVKNNEELVDALAVGVLAAKNDDPVIIVGKSLDYKQASMLADKKFTKITTLGNVPSQSITDIKNTQADEESKVTSVSMVDFKTIELRGSGLDKLGSSNVSMSGNSVVSYTSNGSTSAKVVFSNAFSSGTNTVKVSSNLGNTTSHTFTYSAEVSSVEGSTSVIDTDGIQYVEFTINGGQKRSIAELKALGWNVEFRSPQNIFYNPNNTSSPSYNSSTGKLKVSGFNHNDIYSYEVRLTKGKTTIVSKNQKIDVVAGSNKYQSITSNEVELNDNKVITTSNKLVVGETSNIINVEGIDKNGNKASLTGKFELITSNPAVATVSENQIKAISSGTSQITIKAGNVSKSFTLTVVSNARKVNSVAVDSSSTKVTIGKTSEVGFTVKDQYGDPVKLSEEEILISQSSHDKNGSATGKASSTDIKGKGKITVTGVRLSDSSSPTTGTATLVLKHSDTKDTVLKSISVSISSTVGEIKSYDLSLDSDDKTIDVYDENEDQKAKFTLKGYDSKGYFVEDIVLQDNTPTEKPGGMDSSSKDKWIKSTNTDVAEVKVEDGKIVMIAKKAGTATLEIYEGTSRKDYEAITVKDNTPTMTSIDMNLIGKITELTSKDGVVTGGVFDVTKILNTTEEDGKNVVEGLKVDGVKDTIYLETVGNDVILFMDGVVHNTDSKQAKMDKNGKYDENYDTVVATINLLTNEFKEEKNIVGGKITNLASGDKGQILVRVYKGKSEQYKNPFKIETIQVDIPK